MAKNHRITPSECTTPRRAKTSPAVSASVAAAALCAVLPAQRKDRIVWTDGTSAKGVRVKNFTWQEVQWNSSRGDASKSADLVASLKIEAVEDAFAQQGASVGINLLGHRPINFTAAFSDYHVTGLNPAGNACLTDLAFVTRRFRIVQSKIEVPFPKSTES